MLCFLKQKSSLRAEAPWSHRERKEGPWRRGVLYGPLGAVGEGLIGIYVFPRGLVEGCG